MSEHTHELEPGQKCPTCSRRVNHPRKPSSPESEVDSFRVPAGEKAVSREREEAAMAHAGIDPSTKYPRWAYRTLLDAYVLQREPGFLARELNDAA